LVAAAGEAQQLQVQVEPLATQLLAGELPLALAYVLPELVACRDLAPPGRHSLSYGLVELLDDPVELASYMLAPGKEEDICAIVGKPHSSFLVDHYEASQRVAMHHIWIDTVPVTTEVPSAHTVCGAPHLPVTNTWFIQSPHVSLDVAGGAPEYAGAAFSVDPGSFEFAIHAINTSDTPMLREMWVNLRTVDHTDKPLSWLAIGGPYKMSIPAGASVTVGGSVAPIGTERTLVALFGHMHSHTSEIRASAFGKQIYKDDNWVEPHTEWFTSLGQGPVTFKPAIDKISWECDIKNDSNATLKWGNYVYTAEMCGFAGIVAAKNSVGVSIVKPWLAEVL
jgi:hypothetical protein